LYASSIRKLLSEMQACAAVGRTDGQTANNKAPSRLALLDLRGVEAVIYVKIRPIPFLGFFVE
jgi:hypothetical protein